MARTVFSKDPQEFNISLAQALKKIPQITAPEWSFFVKTGISKQRTPEDPDFWYVRTASILRQLYIQGVVGVQRLRTRYGGRKNRGVRPARFKKSSGKMLRVMLQQAEAAGFVEKVTGSQFGRRLTKTGREFLDSIEVKEKTIVPLGSYIGKARAVIAQEGDELTQEGEMGEENGIKA